MLYLSVVYQSVGSMVLLISLFASLLFSLSLEFRLGVVCFLRDCSVLYCFWNASFYHNVFLHFLFRFSR